MIGKVVELNPGVSLEGLSEGDVLITHEITEKSTREIYELVTVAGPLFIKTIRRQPMSEMGEGEINIITRMMEDYNEEAGHFDDSGNSLERIGEIDYETHNKLLTKAGL
tara:strand:+ start:534 stop:860 length:327 start_codon:yes stop_codon:yes gene_type:complete